MKSYKLSIGNQTVELGKNTLIMGVLNVTPDSFSDGGNFFSYDRALTHGLKLAADGADIIDIGGESTRPFSAPISIEEEINRVVPVIKELSRQVSIPISIDTKKAGVARQAIEAGASLLNDISALTLDPEMPFVAAEYGDPVVLMHMKGTPETMQIKPKYDDLMGEITAFFKNEIVVAMKKGIKRSNIIIDPGIGFGKRYEHNFSIIKQLHLLESLDAPILVGPSRKAFLRNILKTDESPEIKPGEDAVLYGTLAAAVASVLNGAHIVRVHDPAPARAAVKVADALK